MPESALHCENLPQTSLNSHSKPSSFYRSTRFHKVYGVFFLTFSPFYIIIKVVSGIGTFRICMPRSNERVDKKGDAVKIVLNVL